jgi:hypothetical protein
MSADMPCFFCCSSESQNCIAWGGSYVNLFAESETQNTRMVDLETPYKPLAYGGRSVYLYYSQKCPLRRGPAGNHHWDFDSPITMDSYQPLGSHPRGYEVHQGNIRIPWDVNYLRSLSKIYAHDTPSLQTEYDLDREQTFGRCRDGWVTAVCSWCYGVFITGEIDRERLDFLHLLSVLLRLSRVPFSEVEPPKELSLCREIPLPLRESSKRSKREERCLSDLRARYKSVLPCEAEKIAKDLKDFIRCYGFSV